MDVRWPSTLLLASALAASAARADEPALALVSGTRWYGDTVVTCRVRAADGTTPTTFAWTVRLLRLQVAEGRVEVHPGVNAFAVKIPAVRQVVAGELVLTADGGEAVVVPITAHPPPPPRPFGTRDVGWIGAPPPARAGPTRVAIPHVPIESPTALRRFPGDLVVLAPDVDATPYVPALLEHARGGGDVLSLGVGLAPWIDEIGAPRLPRTGLLFRGLPPDAIAAWAGGGVVAKRGLRPAAGRHLDLVPGLVRLAWVGRGHVLLVRLRVLEALADEPLAVPVLLRLRALLRLADSLRPLAQRAPKAREDRFWRD